MMRKKKQSKLSKPPLHPRKKAAKKKKKNTSCYRICDEYRVKENLTNLFNGNYLIAEIIVQFMMEVKITLKMEDVFKIRNHYFELTLPGIEIYIPTQNVPNLRHLPTTYTNFKIYLLQKRDLQDFLTIDIEHYEKLCLRIF